MYTSRVLTCSSRSKRTELTGFKIGDMSVKTEKNEKADLRRRVEEASMNAWPATHQLLLDGWLIRMSNGFTKRANCVVPLYPAHARQAADSLHPAHSKVELDKIRYCENLYAREQLQTVFRLTTEADSHSLDEVLANRGYTLVDKTDVQVLPLVPEHSISSPPAQPERTGQLRLVTTPQWLREYARLANMPTNTSEQHAGLIRAIQPECAFALLEIDGEVVACALGVLEHDLFGLFDVITDQEMRGRGHARRLLTELLRWGSERGARHAYLQVIANNTAALGLYRQLGFERLYSYWYRRTG